jgi:hypothetical protein
MYDYALGKFYFPSRYWFMSYYWWPLGALDTFGINRIFVVPYENRTLIIENDDRIYTVPSENRTLVVESV